MGRGRAVDQSAEADGRGLSASAHSAVRRYSLGEIWAWLCVLTYRRASRMRSFLRSRRRTVRSVMRAEVTMKQVKTVSRINLHQNPEDLLDQAPSGNAPSYLIQAQDNPEFGNVADPIAPRAVLVELRSGSGDRRVNPPRRVE